MYYGYNDNQELILADKAFIELLGFNSFNELNHSTVMDNLKIKNKKIIIKQEHQTIHANFLQYEMYAKNEEFYLVKLKNIQINQVKSTLTLNKHGLKTDYQDIYLDVEKISKDIGLSVNDYKLYLDSFIDQSIIDEKRLINGNDKVVKNLSNLALTLKIPHINILLLKIQKLSQRERMPLIDEYYTKLALLTLEKPENYEEETIEDIFEEDKSVENKEEILSARFSDLLKNIDEKPKENIEEEFTLDKDIEVINEELIEKSNVKKISLDNVEPLPISYSPQTAADELNLPVVLIEEFVEDFIEQARQDKDHLLTSYYQHDIDNIHELGHKLKGAASNLRINELSDILEEIQFCSDYSKFEELFTKYWGHFLSLEKQINQLKKA